MFSSCFMLFPTFLENQFFWGWGGGGGSLKKQNFVVAPEPVGGRFQVTELPCFTLGIYIKQEVIFVLCYTVV